MSNKVLIQFTHKGYCNGFPVWIHQSHRYGVAVFPRGFPRLAKWYTWLWNLLFTKDLLLVTHEMQDKIFIEQSTENL